MRTKKYTLMVNDSFERTDENCDFEPAFRRWLVSEIEAGKMTPTDAIKLFNFNPKNGLDNIRYWRKKYASELVLPLPEMTAEDRQKIIALQQQIKKLEKALSDAQMKNIAINTLIDVAEEKLKISIRKKPGAKQ